MSARPPKETLGLDMPFEEAWERFVGVSPKELEANIAKDKRKKPPGSKKAKPGAKAVKESNVLSLRDKKTSLRRRGLLRK